VATFLWASRGGVGGLWFHFIADTASSIQLGGMIVTNVKPVRSCRLSARPVTPTSPHSGAGVGFSFGSNPVSPLILGE
jgi:hypothetical protein